MYLSKISSSQLQSWKDSLTGTSGETTLERLQNGVYTLYFHISPHDESITYEAYSPDYPLIGLTIGPDLTIHNAYILREYTECDRNALAYFIATKEKGEGEEELRIRYGSDFDTLNNLSSLSGEERQNFLASKADFQDLLKDLQNDSMGDVCHLNPQLSFDFTAPKGRSGPQITPVIIGEGRHLTRSIPAFLAQVRRGSSIHDGRGNYLSLDMDSFSPQDQRIIFFLSRYFSPDSYYPDITMEVFVGLLLLCKGKNVNLDDELYEVDNEVRKIEIEADDEGKLRLGGLVASNPLFLFKTNAIQPIKATKKILLYSFASLKSSKVAQFILAHPSFPYQALQDQIGADLLPLMKQTDINVSPVFQEKSNQVRTYIAYYLDYDEGNENAKPSLEMRTEFKSRGQTIPLQDYLNSPRNVYDKFRMCLGDLGLSESGTIQGDEAIGTILDRDLSPLNEFASLYLSDNIASITISHHQSGIRLRTESGLDWFDVSFASDTLTPEEVNAILNAYRKKKKYVRVGNDYYATDDESLSKAIEQFSPNEEGLTTEHLPLYKALNLRLDDGLSVEIDDRLKDLFDSLLHFQDAKLSLSPSLESALRPYQKDGVRWLWTLASNGLGGILADDMGLGKSLEMIAFLSLLQEKENILIISPKSLIYNWKNEFEKWDPSRQVEVVEGSKPNRKKTIERMKEAGQGVFVVSYDSLRNDEELYQDILFSTIVLDEAQYIANATALKTKAVKSLHAKHRFVLTGTPIQNSYMDLWSIMDFLMPGYLDGYKDFHLMYSSLSDSNQAQIHRLETQIAPFLLRRTKEEVLKDLPPKTEEITVVQMDDAEAKLYEAYFTNAKMTLKEQRNDGRSRVAILAELTRLRQLCVDPSTFVSNYKDLSAKLTQAIAMVKEAIASGHKVLIFSSFVAVLKHLQIELANLKISSSLIYGDTPAKERLSLADRFNTNEDEKVMLVSLKAGGTGLNLVGADIVIHLDPWWNIAAENQASDRAHRIGQTRPVTVWKLVAKGTIEEKIIELQALKRSLSSIIRVADEEGSSLTQEDIAYLLS
mgnify:FL=1